MSKEQQREYVETLKEMWPTKMSIEQQREYVEILRKMWWKARRVCGMDSKPAYSLAESYWTQKLILLEMEEAK